MFYPLRSLITHQVSQVPKLPILKIIRYKAFPKLITHIQAVSAPITDSYSLIKYNTPPLSFSQAVAALRAYSLVDKDEYINLKMNINLFDPNKRKQVVQLGPSVILFPNQFTDESSVFILCGDEEGDVAKQSGATGYLEERHFSKLESTKLEHDYYLATETVADVVRTMGKLFKQKTPNRRRGSIVHADKLKEAVHQFLATTDLNLVKSKTEKLQGILNTSFGKLSFTDTMLLENLDKILDNLKEYKDPRLETFILNASLTTEYGPSFILSEDIYMRVNNHTSDTSGLI
ncbi:50S ribosomal protein L1, chloroplastic-like [Oopsacas minuta]|uniref:50S ribosomal protein L1, chloroplastic-like n=1 Tax=Oopsacas minuta TaxID=111878 RepID=A0AAV7K6K7_9METZ|nr:50S ribosomal protein L1, chloroplastic-like [Oopsacas minuta]